MKDAQINNIRAITRGNSADALSKIVDAVNKQRFGYSQAEWDNQVKRFGFMEAVTRNIAKFDGEGKPTSDFVQSILSELGKPKAELEKTQADTSYVRTREKFNSQELVNISFLPWLQTIMNSIGQLSRFR